MGYNARNDEIRDNVTLSLWLAVLLFCLIWMQPVNAQENVPGRWHFAENKDSKSCVLVGEAFNSGFALIARPNQFMMSVTLKGGRRPADRDDGPGTITVASTSSLQELINRFQQVTIPFVREPPSQTAHYVAAYIAQVTRSELQKVLELIETASADADGALMFRFGNLEERFLAGASKNEAAAMQACMDKR